MQGRLRSFAPSEGYRRQIRAGDFGAPTDVHGAEMPGLAALKAAAPGELHVRHRDRQSGAEIRYSSRKPRVVSALHEWFDAQVADHGTNAMAGHDHDSMQYDK
jgi:hypothetical protein